MIGIKPKKFQPLSVSQGFTLIELMVTIAVLVIIVSIAAPNISTQLANQRVKSTAATLENALKEARAESIIRRQEMTVAYNNSNSSKNITIKIPTGTTIAKFEISNKSEITATFNPGSITNIIFQPNKVTKEGANVVYTICDSATSNETPKQVQVNNIASITVTNAGRCS